jgi:uncharacterized protein (UPF0332 family)
MIEEQRLLFDRARQALQTARAILRLPDVEAAINRAYYAAYYAATAALLHVGETPKTHKGIHLRFHLHFVSSGSLPEAMGRTLDHAFAMRQRADYEAITVFDERAAADLIADVERFVEAVQEMLTQ